MSEVRQQVLIEAPPNVVWALITDVNRHPEWWPDVEEVQCEDFHEGCSYREVIKVPLGTAEREFVVNEATDCQRFRIDCVVSGAFVDLGLTEAQGSTFIDAAAGMNPIGIRYKAFDAIAGGNYFRKWLDRSLEAMKRAATSRAPEAEDRAAGG
ncbi:MAG: SRPBCC family protein [Actinomycetota bacterium]|nr:SRPBCC family protein [Actinomycetota bacterium]